MDFTIDDLAALVGGDLVSGDGSAVLTGVASLEEAGPSEVSFLGNEKYRSQFAGTTAGVVLLPRGTAPASGPTGVALMEVENPSGAFTRVIARFARDLGEFKPGIASGAHVAEDVEVDPAKVCIRPGAVIESGAVIGAGTEIGAGAVVGRGVRIGEDCLLHPNVVVREFCEIGNRVILQPGSVIGSDGFGYDLQGGRHEKIPQVGIVVLEDDVEVGANSTIDRARFGKTLIGEGSKIDNLVQVAHNVVTGKHCLLVAQSGIAGSSRLGNYVTIAAQAGVAGHIEVVDQVVLTGRAGLTKSLSKPGVFSGMPARPMRESLKAQASQAKVPGLIRELQELKKRIAKLEGE